MAQHLKRTILDIISFAAIFVGYFVHVLGPTSDLWREEGSCKMITMGSRDFWSKAKGARLKVKEKREKEESCNMVIPHLFVNCSG